MFLVTLHQVRPPPKLLSVEIEEPPLGTPFCELPTILVCEPVMAEFVTNEAELFYIRRD